MRPENAVLPVTLNNRFIGELLELWILKEFFMLETTDKLGLDTRFVGFVIAQNKKKRKEKRKAASVPYPERFCLLDSPRRMHIVADLQGVLLKHIMQV